MYLYAIHRARYFLVVCLALSSGQSHSITCLVPNPALLYLASGPALRTDLAGDPAPKTDLALRPKCASSPGGPASVLAYMTLPERPTAPLPCLLQEKRGSRFRRAGEPGAHVGCAVAQLASCAHYPACSTRGTKRGSSSVTSWGGEWRRHNKDGVGKDHP